MANSKQLAETDQHQVAESAEERDAGFIDQHPVGGALLIGAAGAVGAMQAFKKPGDEIVAAYAAVMQPVRTADQNITHASHPVDAFKNKVGQVLDGLDRLTQPGDMNLANSPHPVDATQAQMAAVKQAAEAKVMEINAAGPVKGSALVTETVVGAGIGMLDPGKKVKALGEVVETAATAGQLRGNAWVEDVWQKIPEHNRTDNMRGRVVSSAPTDTGSKVMNAVLDYGKYPVPGYPVSRYTQRTLLESELGLIPQDQVARRYAGVAVNELTPAAILVAGSSVALNNYINENHPSYNYKSLADEFKKAAKSQESLDDMLKDRPELTPAVASYRAIAEEVKDPKVLQAVAEQHAKQIAEKGPESFKDSLQQANYLQPRQQEQQERAHEPAL